MIDVKNKSVHLNGSATQLSQEPSKINQTHQASPKVTQAQSEEQAKRALVKKVINEKLALKAQEEQQLQGYGTSAQAHIA